MNGRDVTGSKTLGKSSVRRRKPLGKSSGILRKETGSQPLVAVPPSLGNPSENLRKSSGTPRKPRKPLEIFGNPSGNLRKSSGNGRKVVGNPSEIFGNPLETPREETTKKSEVRDSPVPTLWNRICVPSLRMHTDTTHAHEPKKSFLERQECESILLRARRMILEEFKAFDVGFLVRGSLDVLFWTRVCPPSWMGRVGTVEG